MANDQTNQEYNSCVMCAGNVQRSNVIYATTFKRMASSNPGALQWFSMDRAGSRVPYLLAGALEGSDLKAMGNIFGAAGKMNIRGYDAQIVTEVSELFKADKDNFPIVFGQLAADKQVEARRAFVGLRAEVHRTAYERACTALANEGIDSQWIPVNFNNPLDTSKGYPLILVAEKALEKDVRKRYYDGAQTGQATPVNQFISHPETFSVEINPLEKMVNAPEIVAVAELPRLVEEAIPEGSIWQALGTIKDNVAATVEEMQQTVRLFKEASPEMVRIVLDYANRSRGC